MQCYIRSFNTFLSLSILHTYFCTCPPTPCGPRHTAGAYGCTISGAGPTAVAVVPDPEVGGRVAGAMGAAFKAAGLEVNSSNVVALDPHGAKFM